MVNYQVLDAFLQKRNARGQENGMEFPKDNEVAIGGVRNLKAAMLVFDIVQSSKFNDKQFITSVSPFIHMAFHIIHDQGGIVDKYTGDGAMASFCGKKFSDKEICEMGLQAALQIANLVEYLPSKYKFSKIRIRIGLDFGPIQVERIGVRGLSHLIIAGQKAVSAKRLESVGKQINSNHNSTICLGYDFYHNLTSTFQKNCEIYQPKGKRGKFFETLVSYYKKTPPYPIYQYTKRL